MKVQELLSSEDKWIQTAYAKDENGITVGSSSPKAVKWCLLGAIFKCYPTEANKILNKIAGATDMYVVDFNYKHTYEEVMELVKELDI